jgi:hypothetical protein
VWIVNLSATQVEVHRAPSDAVYRTRHLAGLDDTLSIEQLPDAKPTRVRDVLGDAADDSSA